MTIKTVSLSKLEFKPEKKEYLSILGIILRRAPLRVHVYEKAGRIIRLLVGDKYNKK
jgi:hypothetical protein